MYDNGDSFSLQGMLPPTACINCGDTRDLGITPYHYERDAPMLAVIILCGLCRMALNNHEIGVKISIRVAGQEPFK